MVPRYIARLALIVPLVAVIAVACEHANPNEPGPVASITVTPTPVTLAPATNQAFTAVVKDAAGNVLSVSPNWSVASGGGSINASTGLFTAGPVAGTYTNTVTASVGSISASATVTVTAAALATITVTPNPQVLAIAGTQQFAAVGKDANGNVIAITPTWAVVASGGAINATGLFTAGTVSGTFTNTVRACSTALCAAGSVSGFATVTVNPSALVTITVTPNPATLAVNASKQFTAVGRDANNNITPIVPAPVWTIEPGHAGGTILTPSGVYVAPAVTGVDTVRATSGSIFGRAGVVITAAAAPIPLGLTAPYGIMAGLSFTCITGGLISADIAISPGSTVTGFPPCVITGTQHLADGTALAAQGALTTLYNTLFGLPCPPANAIVADLGGTTKPAGVYCTAIGIGVTGTLTLDGGGDPNATFVFQAGTSIVTAGDVVLINGAQAKNVWWLSGSSVTLGTASQWKGNIVALTSITLVDNANLIGRALARNGSVTLGTNNTITLP